jgi:hypothetical protein
VELRNPTASTVRVALQRVDGKTLGTLGSSYAPPGTRPHGSTLWLTVGARAVLVPPRSSVTVPVSVQIPAGSSPGDRLSGISIEQLGQSAKASAHKGVAIASVSRYVLGAEISIPGPRVPLIRFTGARAQQQPAGLVFELLARNAGNVILQGVHGWVHITDGDKRVLAQPIEAGTFVSSTSIAYPVNAFSEHPSEGTRYRIRARLIYPGGVANLDTAVTFGHRQAAIQRQYGASPRAGAGTAWWKLGGIAAVILYALGTTALLLRRRGPRAGRGKLRRRDALQTYAEELAQAEASAATAVENRAADDRQPA